MLTFRSRCRGEDPTKIDTQPRPRPCHAPKLNRDSQWLGRSVLSINVFLSLRWPQATITCLRNFKSQLQPTSDATSELNRAGYSWIQLTCGVIQLTCGVYISSIRLCSELFAIFTCKCQPEEAIFTHDVFEITSYDTLVILFR